MPDSFANFTSSLESPAASIFAITPDDGAELGNATRALNVAVSGKVRVTTVSGATDTIHIAAGIAFPIRATRVWATGTTATGIVGMF